MADTNDDEEESVDRSPLPAIHRALQEQLTSEVTEDARKYAEQRVRLVRAAGRPIPQNYARELVDDAHADTWLGDSDWDPRRCSLLCHLRGEIKQRTWMEIRHGRFRHLSLDAPPANDSRDGKDMRAALDHASYGDIGEIMLAALTKRVCAELRGLAVGDKPALAIVRCWEHGFVDRDEIIEITRLDGAVYDAKRKRLLYLSHDLPPDLREAVQDFLRSAS